MGLSNFSPNSDSILLIVLIKTALSVAAVAGQLLRRLRISTSSDDVAENSEEVATAEALRQLPVTRFPHAGAASPSPRPGAPKKSCVVCLRKFRGGEEIRRLLCGHEFHKGCVDRWFCHQLTCPLCRALALYEGQTEPTLISPETIFSFSWRYVCMHGGA